MARPVTRARSRIARVGSSRHPGPEPYRPHWLVPFPGPGAVSVTGHFCAGPLASECLALTLRWAETLPLLRWAQSLWRAGPYYAGPGRPAWLVPFPGPGALTLHCGSVRTRPALLRWARGLCRDLALCQRLFPQTRVEPGSQGESVMGGLLRLQLLAALPVSRR